MELKNEKDEQNKKKNLYLSSTVLWLLAALAMAVAAFRVDSSQFFTYALGFAAVGVVFLVLYLRLRAQTKSEDPTAKLRKRK